MKLSNYNIFVEKNNIVIGFNTINNNLIAISKNSYNQFKEYTNNILDFKQINENLFESFVNNGFVIQSGKDELDELRLSHKEYCFNKHYDLILIPTLDCNLKCWYCWEKHIPNSMMSPEIQARVLNHIKQELEYNNLDSLTIEWFGGEPLLYFDEVVYPLGLSIKKLLEEKNKSFRCSFVTNGTFIDKNNIEKLKELNSSFQITLDGFKDKHNKVRIKKSNNEGTYEKILNALYLISDNIEDAGINLRINFDDNTLKNIEELAYDLKDLNRSKINIHLERVWQTAKERTDNNKLLQDAIMLLTANNFQVDYGNFINRLSSCRSDRYRQVCVNYDGNVFKCNGRPFTTENREGILSESGEIIFDRDKIAKRLGNTTFENKMCIECKMLPLCMGPCSQKCLENNWQNLENVCTLKTFEMSIDDYVIFLFNNSYNAQKVESLSL